MPSGATSDVTSFYESVRTLCVDRLREALNPETALFDRQLRDGRWDRTLSTEDLTSTAICLIGASRAVVKPDELRLDPGETLEAMFSAYRRHGYPGGIGLVLWANAVWNGPTIGNVAEATGAPLDRPRQLVTQLTTMETAWLVSGLLHERARADGAVTREALRVARQELLSRFVPEARAFAHASSEAPLVHRARRFVANFADEIYSVQALAFLARVDADAAARSTAESAARRLIELQGSLGQWWWHYDARRGGVAAPFPVYSVHQHAMAPMALLALAEATGADVSAPLALSLAWLDRNELGLSMIDRDRGTIWRDIELDEGSVGRLLRHARSVTQGAAGRAAPGPLRLNHETRPYEWAWCLYAGAIARGTPRGAHVV